MRSLAKILHISNFPPGPVLDGGTSRENALEQFLAGYGAKHIIVQDESFKRSKARRLLRLSGIMDEIRAYRPDLVVLYYPSYPFFWQHKVTPYFWMSVLFAELLRRASKKQGFDIVIDIRDLPAFQYKDLGFPIEMKPGTLRWFDRFVFSRANCLWVCSESIGHLVHECYGIAESRLITTLNGYRTPIKPSTDYGGRLKLAYAGSLNRERGIKTLIDSLFRSEIQDFELHLCGLYGDWILDEYKDSRLVFHGSLTNEQASSTLSQCHIGIIPYPERGYYHLAYATKLSFYMGLGLPVLCSNAHETASHVRRLGVGLCRPMDDFDSAFQTLDNNRDQIKDWQRRVLEVREEFSWHAIFARSLAETTNRCALTSP